MHQNSSLTLCILIGAVLSSVTYYFIKLFFELCWQIVIHNMATSLHCYFKL